MEDSLQGNEIIYMITLGIVIMLAFALAFVGFFYFAQQRLMQEKMAQQTLKLEHQAALLYHNITTQEEERKRIAKDLHDEVGSKLNVIFLNLHRLKKADSKSQAFITALDDIKTVVNTTIATTREISHNLLPPTLEGFGLVETIKELSEHYDKTEVVKVTVEVCENANPTMDKMVELNIFRVIQELIKNSILHGKAKHIGIRLWLGTTQFKLEYQDDGLGFDTTILAQRKGLGMQNIESRMNMIGATFEFQSAPNEGVLFSMQRVENKLEIGV